MFRFVHKLGGSWGHWGGLAPARYQPRPDARYRRSKAFILDPEGFHRQLDVEIADHIGKCKQRGLHPALRLNGTTDIYWERDSTFFRRWPGLDTYDYTKHAARYFDWLAGRGSFDPNVFEGRYHLTFSYSGENLDACRASA